MTLQCGTSFLLNLGSFLLQLCNKGTKVTTANLRYFFSLIIWDSEVTFKNDQRLNNVKLIFVLMLTFEFKDLFV